MSRTEELTGVFSHERHAFQDNTPERTVIAEVSANGKGVVTIKGRALRGQLEYGMTYRFLGVWHTHDKYGKQFVFNSFCIAEPAGELGVTKYLAKAPHIGRSRARTLWDHFGAEAVATLREQPDAACEVVKGLTPDKAKEAAAWLELNKRLEAVTIELMNLLGNRHLPRDIVTRCIGRWGENAVSYITENPYALMEFSGVGFLKCDALYKELNKPLDSLMRQALCGWHALASDTGGNTWFPETVFRQAVGQNVTGAQLDIDAALAWADEREIIRRRVGPGDSRWVADARKADNESALATHLRRALDETLDDFGLTDLSRLQWPVVDSLDDAADAFHLTDEQKTEAAKAMTGRIGLLLGSPGCGKTFVLARIIRAIQKAGRSFAVCAPTGKAASRITESLAKAGVSVTARTIHSTLVVKSNEEGGGGWSFEHGQDNPLPVDFIFCDEASMPDTDIAAHLLTARRKGAHLLFVGDPNQLAPVGHGAPLRDMIAAGVPVGQLRTVQRNAGRIVKACASIRDHHRFEAAKEIDLVADDPENLYVATCKPDEQMRTIKDWLERIRDAGPDFAAAMGFSRKPDVIWDVQVLCPLNDSGPVSRKALNKELQACLNPTGKQFPGLPFRMGDKAICTKNSRLPAGPGCPSSEVDEEGKVYVANGEQAAVVGIEPGRIVMRLDTPRRVVAIPRSKPKACDDKSDAGGLGDWDLGYAISVHKSQGSEWPVCLVVIDESGGAKWVCKREWVTTAISRAKALCVCVGRASTANDFCRRSGLWDRKTFLVEKVRELGRG